MKRDRISLDVEVPDVEVEALQLVVCCGSSSLSVHEAGRPGSGQWGVWTAWLGSLVDDLVYQTAQGATEAATVHVAATERKRLAHQELNVVLDAADSGDAP